MANIFDELKEIETKLEEERNAPSEPKEEPKPEPEPKQEEPAEPEPKPVDEPVEDENKAKTTAYEERKSKRLERELEENKKLLAAALAARQPAPEPPAPRAPALPDPEMDPDAARDYDLQEMRRELAELRNERMKEAALKEFIGESEKVLGEIPDVKEVIDAGFNEIVRASMLFNPSVSAIAAQDAAKRSILMIAAQAVSDGKNPAVAVYEHFRARGISAPAKPKIEAEKVPETQKLEAVMRNKQKSGSPLTGGGSSAKIPVTTQRKMDMTPGEYMKLSPEEQASFASVLIN